MISLNKNTIQKFNVQGPRYTSYPTAPNWTQDVTSRHYEHVLKELGTADQAISMYIHIPFCQKLCYFCGCMMKVRPQKDQYGDEYLDHLIKEIKQIADLIGTRKQITQFHIGGGTPNYLSETQMQRLWDTVIEYFDIDPEGEVAIEVDPRTVNQSKLSHLKKLGFNRISMGIQDFDATVQEAINRVQPYALVKEIYDICRNLQFDSVNFDLIYGLPHQNLKTFAKTIEQVIDLKPDRIALYSFAHIPWLKKHQELMAPETLPNADEKIDIFLMARESLLNHGYDAIAMDHFALKTDAMAKAFIKGTLYRNFMGYTLRYTEDFIGLGVSSIGFLQNTYVQNHKDLKQYYAQVEQGYLPTERGKMLSLDDQVRLWVINQLMCQFKIDKHAFEEKFLQSFDEYFQKEQNHLTQCVNDGLVEISPQYLIVTELGKLFVRNICIGFDAYFTPENKQRFSQTV